MKVFWWLYDVKWKGCLCEKFWFLKWFELSGCFCVVCMMYFGRVACVKSFGFWSDLLAEWKFDLMQYDSTQNEAWSCGTCPDEGFRRCASTIWQGQEDGYPRCPQVCPFFFYSLLFFPFFYFHKFFYCVNNHSFFASGCWGFKLVTSTACWVAFLLKSGGTTMTPSRYAFPSFSNLLQ